jgi:hypothetical protein
MAGVLYETGTTCPLRAPRFIPDFLVGSLMLIFLAFCVVVLFHFLSSSCVLCTQCCQCLWIVFILCLVYPMLPVSLDCLHSVSCVPNVASVSGLSSSTVLCTQCCQCLWIVHSWLPLQFSLALNYILLILTCPSSLNFFQSFSISLSLIV